MNCKGFVNLTGIFSVCAGISVALISCGEDAVSPELDEKVLVSGISIDATSHLPLLIGREYQLEWSVSPENATNKNVIWSSARPEIASVSEGGLVTARALGTAVITASPEWGYATTASVTVEVIDKIISIEDITLTNAEDELSVYETASVQLTWTTVPENPTYPALEWESLTPDIAVVTETGLVTGVRAGKARIKATATDEMGYSEEFEITVMEMIPVESLELDGTRTEFAIGEVSKLGVKVTPDNATLSTLAWESSDPDVLTVDENGIVTVHDYGSATITASATYGESSVSDELTVRVVEGLVNDEFDYVNPWNIFNNQGTVAGLVNGELVLTPGTDKNYFAFRITRTGGVNFNVGNYPILAIKVELPEGVFTESTKMESYLDLWTRNQEPAGKYGENTDGGNNQMEVKEIGSNIRVFVADFTEKGLGDSNTMMPTGPFNIENLVFELWKLWYGDVETSQSVRIDWIKTFKSESELNALIAEESGN